MNLLSHISAFEYWRSVGRPGVVRPEPTSIRHVPQAFDAGAFDWLCGMGRLSNPVHGMVSRKAHNGRTGTIRPDRPPESDAISHFRPSDFPRGLVFKISGDQLIVSPEFALAQISQYVTCAELAGLTCEFCGLYAPLEEADGGLVAREPLTSKAKIASFYAKAKGMHGVKALREASAYCFDRSRSPMETAVAILLALPFRRGGYALDGFVLNSRQPLDWVNRGLAGIDDLEPDILWPEGRVVIEYDSDAFHADAGRIANDARRKNLLLASGYSVVTLTTSQVANVNQMDITAKQLGRLLGRRMRGMELLGFG